MSHYKQPSQPDKRENIYPENPIGIENCEHCQGLGYVYDRYQMETDTDYSKSKRGKQIWVGRTYYKQCPVCDPKNPYKPITDCPICLGARTNSKSNPCPYCDMIYNKGGYADKNRMEYAKESSTWGMYKSNGSYIPEKFMNDRIDILLWIAKEIESQCKSYKKEKPEEFQYNPLAYAYRKVLREIWQ